MESIFSIVYKSYNTHPPTFPLSSSNTENICAVFIMSKASTDAAWKRNRNETQSQFSRYSPVGKLKQQNKETEACVGGSIWRTSKLLWDYFGKKNTNIDCFTHFLCLHLLRHLFWSLDNIVNSIKRLEAVKAQCIHGSKTSFYTMECPYLCILILPFGLRA